MESRIRPNLVRVLFPDDRGGGGGDHRVELFPQVQKFPVPRRL